MDHEKDYDRDGDRGDTLNGADLKNKLQDSLAKENEMMKDYLITAERVHSNDELKERLENFSEGNAKRSSQLEDELENM